MKKVILTAIIASAQLVCANALGAQEQIACQLAARGNVKAILIQSGTYKQVPNRPGVVIDDPGTLILLGPNGITEKVTPSPGTGGTFNQFNFPTHFIYKNDARTSQVLKFETKQLGQVLIAYDCNLPNYLHCENNDGSSSSTARVAINVGGKSVLNFDGKSLPFCKRRLLK